MAAKAQLTVRLAPANLHALAYIAQRSDFLPAEIAREMVNAGIEAVLSKRGWRRDWEQTYRAWQAEQGAVPDRFEAPEQADYDALAAGLTHTPREQTAQSKPLSATIAESLAMIERSEARLAGQNPRA